MIYIIRHGQTEMNNVKALQGRSDHPLNETGVKQAEDTAKLLADQGIKFDYVFSSPLIRAVQTAKLISPENEPVVDERLIEMDYGKYEGLELSNMPPEIKFFFSDFVNNPAPDTMEQLPAVVDRLGEFLEEIKGLKGNILISTHAIAMKGALEYLTPDSKGSYWSKYIGNCAVYSAENDENGIGVPEELICITPKVLGC
ncbi:MAG: histidine phosphatase family protein [Lachnospiraceae bacterium]|nr:histidine phosphatase family protein [Lachnospiraceae bacterium]